MHRWTAARRLAPLLLLGASACARPRVVQVYPQLGEYVGREIGSVSWENTAPFKPDSLAHLTNTKPTRCRLLGVLPFCFPGTHWGLQVHRLDLSTMAADLTRLTLLYVQSGYFGTRVVPEISQPPEQGKPIAVAFVVRRGPGVVLDSLVVEGTEGIADPDSLIRIIPLKVGRLFDVGDFVSSADTIKRILQKRGHFFAEVLRNYSVDTIQDRATASLVAVPGPRVVVDSVVVVGNDVLSRTTILRQLTFRPGSLLRQSALTASQRNLYNLDMVALSAVGVAPDSLQRAPWDSTTATVSVQITEAAEHVVETSVGWGTQDCGRVGGTWVDRSFVGGARRLQTSASLSRICTGAKAQDVNLSPTGEPLPYAQTLDYQLALELRQPYFLAPQNNVIANIYAERQSETEIYRRTAQGSRLVFSRELSLTDVLSASLNIERRRTEVAPALYCATFAVCTPADLAALQQLHWRNALSGSWTRSASNSVVDPTRGYTLQSNLMWASPLLASSYDFLRADVQAALYHEIRPGWVLSFFLRGGTFLTPAGIDSTNFVPPEERFYAGGASSVRGYSRNDLGPGIWLFSGSQSQLPVNPADRSLSVSFLPTGGISVGVASVELRFPSPILPSRLNLAAFVDAGTVGLRPVWEGLPPWRVTPGVGVRIPTPVGPVRIDVAYNPYPRPTEPLFVQDFTTGTVEEVTAAYTPNPASFWGRLHFHIALGQAF